MSCVVGRRSAWAEGCVRAYLDRVRNENPGGSRILAVGESLSPKGQGFLGNVDQPRVS